MTYTIRPIGQAITPYNEAKYARRQHRERETQAAIEAVRVHAGVRPNLPNMAREAAWDRSERRV